MYKFILNAWYKYFPPESVRYWKTRGSVQAKVTEAPEGHLVMHLQGEKYPFPGFPRGRLLFGSLSPLKHQIKNKIFNDSWALMKDGKDKDIAQHIRDKFDEIIELGEQSKYEMLPPEKMCPSVREIHRALTVACGKNKKAHKVKEILCFILQEDDGYRFRVQWMARFMNVWFRKPTIGDFEKSLKLLEHAEMIGDMKERILLLRTILLIALKDAGIRHIFETFSEDIDWKKVKLSKGDKYFFRGKWFKVDYPEYQY